MLAPLLGSPLEGEARGEQLSHELPPSSVEGWGRRAESQGWWCRGRGRETLLWSSCEGGDVAGGRALLRRSCTQCRAKVGAGLSLATARGCINI